jgi:acyl-coenzyme A thioesterase 13
MSKVFYLKPNHVAFENDAIKHMAPIKIGYKFGDGMEQAKYTSLPNYQWKNGMEGICSKCVVVDIKENFIKCEMPVEEKHLNFGLGLHGAVSMQIVDSIGSLVLFAARPESNHVSVDISTSFFSGCGVGDILEIDCFLEKMGRKLAFIKVNIYNKETKVKISSGSHTKYFVS